MTTGVRVGRQAVDLTAALGLAAGLTYRVAVVGRLPIEISVGTAHDVEDAQTLRPQEWFILTAPADTLWGRCWGSSRVSSILLRDELGPPRDKRRIAASTEFRPGGSFIAQAVGAGAVSYETLDGATETTETLAAGDIIQVAGVPVRLRAILDTTAIAVDVGIF